MVLDSAQVDDNDFKSFRCLKKKGERREDDLLMLVKGGKKVGEREKESVSKHTET